MGRRFQAARRGEVDVDLRAVFVDAVARDAAQRVSDVEALAVDHREDDQGEDDDGDDFFHGVVSILAARGKSKGKRGDRRGRGGARRKRRTQWTRWKNAMGAMFEARHRPTDWAGMGRAFGPEIQGSFALRAQDDGG